MSAVSTTDLWQAFVEQNHKILSAKIIRNLVLHNLSPFQIQTQSNNPTTTPSNYPQSKSTDSFCAYNKNQALTKAIFVLGKHVNYKSQRDMSTLQ